MAKQPKPEPKRKLTDPEFDDYDCQPEPKVPPSPGAQDQLNDMRERFGLPRKEAEE